MNTNWITTFSRLFHRHEMHFLAPFDFFTNRNDRFSTCKISTLSHAWSLKRVLFSGGASPYRPLLGVPPTHTHTREEALSFVLWFSVFINTVLPLYYYKVSSGSWRPVRSARWVNINKTDFNPSWRLPFLLQGHSSGSFQQLINVVYTSKHIAVFCERKSVCLAHT